MSTEEMVSLFDEVKDNKEIFIDNLNQSFKQHNITYEELSKETGINIITLQKIFHGNIFPSYIQFIKLINSLQKNIFVRFIKM